MRREPGPIEYLEGQLDLVEWIEEQRERSQSEITRCDHEQERQPIKRRETWKDI